MSETTRKKLLYLLEFMDSYIEESIYHVLSDSIDDPQYSAVTTNNLINCYIQVMREIMGNIDIVNTDDYMEQNCFTLTEINIFKSRVKEEAPYYVGEQFV